MVSWQGTMLLNPSSFHLIELDTIASRSLSENTLYCLCSSIYNEVLFYTLKLYPGTTSSTLFSPTVFLFLWCCCVTSKWPRYILCSRKTNKRIQHPTIHCYSGTINPWIYIFVCVYLTFLLAIFHKVLWGNQSPGEENVTTRKSKKTKQKAIKRFVS